MSAAASLLVVIPTLNEAAHIEALIARLLADPALSDAALVVADGGSGDGTREIVSRLAAADPRVALLDNPARLQAAGVNAAVRARGEGRAWLLRVDAHAGYPADYASRLLAAQAATGADAVVVPMRTVGHGGFQSAVAAAQNSGIGTGGSAHRHAGDGRWVDHGHHALMRLAAYRAAGGYDEGFVANEDAELDARLTRAGGRIWLAGDVVVDYHPRSAPAPLFRQYFRYGRGRARNLTRHRMRMKLRQLLPLAVAPACALLVLAPLQPLLALPALAWAAACLLAGLALAARARSPALWLAGPAAMIMHLAWSAGFWRQALLGPRPGPEPAPF